MYQLTKTAFRLWNKKKKNQRFGKKTHWALQHYNREPGVFLNLGFSLIHTSRECDVIICWEFVRKYSHSQKVWTSLQAPSPGKIDNGAQVGAVAQVTAQVGAQAEVWWKGSQMKLNWPLVLTSILSSCMTSEFFSVLRASNIVCFCIRLSVRARSLDSSSICDVLLALFAIICRIQIKHYL